MTKLNSFTLPDKTNYIVEKGSNSNGEYIKYSDGTMICYGIITRSGTLADYWNEVTSFFIDYIPFPQKFKTIKSCDVSLISGYPCWLGVSYDNEGTLTVDHTQPMRLFSIKQFKGGVATVKISYFAVGTWK